MAAARSAALPAAAGAADSPVVQSHLRELALTLPPGVAVSPGAADGLVACADEQIRFDSSEPAACPDASKVGTRRDRQSADRRRV